MLKILQARLQQYVNRELPDVQAGFRCLGIAFLSRADREIAVFRHVAPPSRLRLEFPRKTASSEVRGEGREPLADKAGESTLLSRSGGEKGLR